MVRAPKATKTPAAEPEVDETEDGLEYAHYLDKDPSELHELCAEWIQDRTGYEMDLRTVQLVLVLYSKFQRSPENKADIEERRKRAAENKAAAEKRATERDAKKATEPVTRTRKGAAASEDADDEAPAPRRGRPAKTAAAAAPARTSRRRPTVD